MTGRTSTHAPITRSASVRVQPGGGFKNLDPMRRSEEQENDAGAESERPRRPNETHSHVLEN